MREATGGGAGEGGRDAAPKTRTPHKDVGKYKVSCSGFLPKTKPMQQSCSHSNAICNQSFKKRKELRTQEQHGTTTRCRTQRRNVRNDRSRNRRTHEVPFIAGCSHFTQKNTRFRAPASSPTHPPFNIYAAFPSYHLPLLPPFIKVSFCCDVLLMYCSVVQSLTPPFIKVNSFVMYCYVV